MSPNRRFRCSAASIATLALAACVAEDPLSPGAPQPNSVASRATSLPPIPEDGPLSLDEEYDRVARVEVPGFAGHYLDENGGSVILLTDIRQAEKAQAFVDRERARLFLAPQSHQEVTVVASRYDFTQLRVWATRIAPELVKHKQFAIDIDEVNNRVCVAVKSQRAREVVIDDVRTALIPSDAIQVVVEQLPVERTSLQEYAFVKRGGVQIQAAATGLCTFGFNASVNGHQGFITASHCVSPKFALTGATVYQPSVSSTSVVGTELFDPPKTWCVPDLYFCRKSDAAFVENGPFTTWDYSINQTTSVTYNADASLDIGLVLEVRSKSLFYMPVGASILKVGRTTGSTHGHVFQSCVTIGDLQCQTKAHLWSKPGDSGSPIYVNTLNPAFSVQLLGLLWGGPYGTWTETWFSPMRGIEADLGSGVQVCPIVLIGCA